MIREFPMTSDIKYFDHVSVVLIVVLICDVRMVVHAGVYELFLAYLACIKIHKVIQKPVHFSRNSGKLNCLCYGDLTQNFRDYTYFKLISSSQSAVSLSKLSSTSRVLNIS